MPKYNLSLFILLFSFSICQLCSGQQLAVAADNGAYYRIVSNTGAPFPEAKNAKTWYFKVMEATDSSLSVDCKLVSYIDETNGRLFNTDDPVTCRPISSIDLEMLSLLNRSFLYTVQKGRVADQPSIARIFEESIRSWQLRDEMAYIFKQNPNGYLQREMQVLFPVLLNRARGLSSDSVVHYNVTAQNVQPVQVDTIIRLDPKEVAIRLFPEDVKTAIVTASRFSQALFQAPEYDSAKVEAYFARYDPVYGNANFYRLVKLDLLAGHIMTNIQRYDSLLLKIPDSILASYPTHLFNKAQTVINTTVDSAYQTIRYLGKDKSNFKSWVQESFSQQFLHDEESAAAMKEELKNGGVPVKEIDQIINNAIRSRIISKVLIDRLARDNDSNIRNEIYPMYLWVQAKRHASNTDSVLEFAGALDKISDSNNYSNPHRYGLLVYKQLLASGHAGEAARMLDHQIAGMERNVKDSTNYDRYAEQNILAYAYELKSDAVKTADPKAAMNYLSKAAGCSPRSQKEKVYTSFYDRVFLDSKESYRPEFAEALIRQGNMKDGMIELSEQLNTDPSFIEELQQAFARNMPKADFYRFFTEGIVQSWKTAPGFSLKSPDGKTTFKLGDYRGKWLLIDFWGTWCGPCREELPKINDFVKKIANRKDLAFLSIACRDRNEPVIRYLADNNYHIPVSMSNGSVERDYEVPYYPSKFLVSPSGKLLPISIGQDWQKVVEQFTSLHPKQMASKLVNEKNN